jgi:hypothetical protein
MMTINGGPEDWLGILLVIVTLVLVGWIFVLEGIH